MTVFDWYTTGVWHHGIPIMIFFCHENAPVEPMLGGELQTDPPSQR